MTVKELIEKLSELDPDLKVFRKVPDDHEEVSDAVVYPTLEYLGAGPSELDYRLQTGIDHVTGEEVTIRIPFTRFRPAIYGPGVLVE